MRGPGSTRSESASRSTSSASGGDPWHEVLGTWAFTFDLPIAGGRTLDLDTAATVVGVTATAVGLSSTPTTVRIQVRWSDRGLSTSGRTSVATSYHDGHEIPMGGGGTVFEVETLDLLAGTTDPGGHWRVVLDETISDSPDGDQVRLRGPRILEFDVARR